MARDLIINSTTRIKADELKLSFSRSSGAGGQNVNKVNSKATLRWNVFKSSVFSRDQKEKFYQYHSNSINKIGDFIVSSSESREQAKNINICYEKLRKAVLKALQKTKKRKKSTPTVLSREKRIVGKKIVSTKKKLRKRPSSLE